MIVETAVFPLTLTVFFASGFAALLYQVVWQRLLAIFSGADVYSATVIVAAFMGGLGLGHLAGGHVADRVSRRAALALFAASEGAIALFGISSAALYYGFLYERLGSLALGRGSVAVILFASLLWPTFFMGASLPLLARAVTDRLDRAASMIGSLYGFNTLGAAAGAVVATWLLLPALGLEGSLRVGALLNAVCAIVVVPLALRIGRGGHREAPAAPGVVPLGNATNAPHAFRTWALLYALAGFVALSYEIVWFRLLGVMAKSTAFTFGTLLAMYLVGLGTGAAAGSTVARRLRRPDVAFLVLQASAGLLAAVLVGLLVSIADDVRVFRSYFASYEPLSVRDSVAALRTLGGHLLHGTYTAADVPANFLRFYVALPLLLVVPPTFLMGCAFPCLQRVVHTDVGSVGRRVGTLLLANIAGSILGTVVTGSLALSLLGTAATLRLLVLVSGSFAVAALVMAFRGRGVPDDSRVSATNAAAGARQHPDGRSGVRRLAQAAAVGALVVTIAAIMPDAAMLWSRLHGTTPDRMIMAEDDSGVSVIKADTAGFAGTKVVFVNGVGQSLIPYGDVHTALGAVPALLHQNPRTVAVIGLGSGDTAYAASVRPETTQVICVEIIRPQLATLRELGARDSYGGLRALLRDPRVEHVFGDGRAYLMRTTRRFDIIEADALRPTSAYAGNLYSEAYFTLVRERLNPGGLAATWVPTQRVYNTFVRVFPYVVSVPGILLGSRDPIHVDMDALTERLGDTRIQGHFEQAGVDIVQLMRGYLDPVPMPMGPEVSRGAGLEVNTDLFPRDEFDLSPMPR